MPYGTIKVDNITFTDNSVDKTVSLSGLIQNPTFTGNVTVTGTISGDVIRGGTTISGVTVTGTTANFVSGVFTTQLSGATILATTGNFTSLTGTTTTGTTANFVSGVFTTQLSGATITGTTANFTSGNFTSLNGTTTTVTSGVFSAGSVTAPSVAVGTGTTYKPGIYSPGTDQLAISTNGVGRVYVNTTGLGVDIASPGAPLEVQSDSGGTGIRIRGRATANAGTLRFFANDGTTQQAKFEISDSALEIGSLTNVPIIVNTNSTERLRITSAGLVGIGTSGPDANSMITVLNATTASYRAQNNVGGAAIFGVSDSASSEGFINASNAFRFKVDGTTRASLTATGLGIGTTGPSAKLEVAGGNIRVDNNQGIEWGGVNNYIYGNESTDFIAIATNGTERARIDSSGRLLVGTSSTSATSTAVFASRSDAAAASLIAFHTTESTVTDGANFCTLSFGNTATTGVNAGAFIQAQRDGGTWTNNTSMPGRLVFSTTPDGLASPTERMRIRADGATIFFNTSLVFPNTDNVVQLGGASNRMTALFAVNGTIQTSDGREKTTVTDSQLGSNFIKALRPVSYKWIEGGNRSTGERDEDGNYIYESVPGTRTHWGFIAQEVKEVVDAAGVDFGGWVLTEKDDSESRQALRYDQFIAPLTKALQEAMAEIDILKVKVAALEGA